MDFDDYDVWERGAEQVDMREELRSAQKRKSLFEKLHESKMTQMNQF